MIRSHRTPYVSSRQKTGGGGYGDYYNSQFGNGVDVYSGRAFQNGHGFGGALLGLMRSATPLLKTVGKSLLRAGVGVAKDVMDGESFKNSIKSRGIGALKNLISPAKKSSTVKRAGSLKKRKRSPQTGSSVMRHPATKRRREDIFDF